ncbi:MAG: hypothetical protein Q9204_009005, partial [Flavoplaca sp. TL-2023a]
DQSHGKGKPHAECGLAYYKVADAFSNDLQSSRDVALMHLTLLRASRQIYVEANRILWTTNTFSFNDGPTFGEFMKTRNIHQKRLIHNLRFEMRWGWGDEFRWNSAFSMALVKSLSGLRTLRLQIVCNLKKECWEYNKDRFVRLSTYTESLRKLSIMPLRSTEIAVRTSSSKGGPLLWRLHPGNREDFWQKGDREKCAEELKALLLDPKGADAYADFQASQASRRAELDERLRNFAGVWTPWLMIP